jgi:hypothetical protein
LALLMASAGACTMLAGLDDLRFGESAGSQGGASSTSASTAASMGGQADDCPPGFGDCDGAPGCETDLMTDDANCGMCGRDCGVDTCDRGSCPPLAIALGQDGPFDVGFVAGYVYWINHQTGQVRRCASSDGYMAQVGSMWRCPLDGCAPSEPAWIPNVTDPTAVAVCDAYVYWRSNNGNIQRAAKGSMGAETIVASTGNGEIACDGDVFYWSELENGVLKGCRDTGGGCNVTQQELPGLNRPGPLTLDADYVFVGTRSTDNDPDAVLRLTRATGDATTLADGLDDVSGIAIDATHVYFVEFSTGSLLAVPKDGSALPQPVAQGIPALGRVAVGNGFAFMSTDANPGTIWRYSLDVP